MKVFVVIEKVRNEFDFDSNCKIFGTMEKAKDYFNQRLETLYNNYNCEYWLEQAEMDGVLGDEIDYMKDETSADYYDQDGSFVISIDEMEVI